MKAQPQFLTWPKAFSAGTSRCGGKGWNLARLHRYGFDVPVGGVLTVEGYAQILRIASIAGQVDALRAEQSARVLSHRAAAHISRNEAKRVPLN
jgi:hypothetical protein